MICRYNGNVDELPDWARVHLLPDEEIVRLSGIGAFSNQTGSFIVRPGDYIVVRRDNSVAVLDPETVAALYETAYSFY